MRYAALGKRFSDLRSTRAAPLPAVGLMTTCSIKRTLHRFDISAQVEYIIQGYDVGFKEKPWKTGE